MPCCPCRKVLFLLKKRHTYHYGYPEHPHPPHPPHPGHPRPPDHPHSKEPFSSGLYNSARFAADMLEKNGYETKLVEVVDGNDIDREVYQYKPEITILEALWVTPEKLQEVQRLHKKVKWIVRLHSEMAFLGLEGIAIEWIKGYWKIHHTYVAANSKRALLDLQVIQNAMHEPHQAPILLLPTYYPPTSFEHRPISGKHEIRITSPGAIRPLKNQFVQAVAAMRYAEDNKKKLLFYINTTRSEQGGDAMFKNMVNLFKGTRHELRGIHWLTHREFIQFLQSMDVGMQTSFTETFNICAADLVSCNVPLVASKEIPWTTELCHADPNDTVDIAEKIERVLRWESFINALNTHGLHKFGRETEEIWLNELGPL